MLRKNWDRLRSALRRDRLPVLTPQQGYDRWAASYEENMNPVQVLEAVALARLLPDLRGQRVLDLGCGKGRVSRMALEHGASATTGVDVSEAMLEAATAALRNVMRHLPARRGRQRVSHGPRRTRDRRGRRRWPP